MKIAETNAQLRSTIASRTLETPKENENKNAKRKKKIKYAKCAPFALIPNTKNATIKRLSA